MAVLVEAGYNLPRETWAVIRGLFRVLRDVGPDISALEGYLSDHHLTLGELPDIIRSAFDPPQPLDQLQTKKPPRGFDSERELLQYLGPARPGYEWHHIIEQNGQFRPDLTSPEGIRDWIQNTDNMVQMPVIKHYMISGEMSAKSFGGLRLRDIVRTYPPQLQRQTGIDLLRDAGVIR